MIFNLRLYTATVISILNNQIFVKFTVISNNFCFILGLIYIAPDKCLESFLDDFNCNINKFFSDFPNTPLFVGGDFNSRVADLNQLDHDSFQFSNSVFSKRVSLDKMLNSRAKPLVNNLELNDLILLNGRCLGDVPANFTFLGPNGASVIDLAWCSTGALPFIQGLQVLQLATLSDHFPLVLDISFVLGNISNVKSLKFQFNNEKANLFSCCMANKKEVANTNCDINGLNSTLILTIKDVASSLEMCTFSVNNNNFVKNKPWLDKECRSPKKRVKDALMICKGDKFSNLSRNLYYKEKHTYIKIIKSKK